MAHICRLLHFSHKPVQGQVCYSHSPTPLYQLSVLVTFLLCVTKCLGGVGWGNRERVEFDSSFKGIKSIMEQKAYHQGHKKTRRIALITRKQETRSNAQLQFLFSFNLKPMLWGTTIFPKSNENKSETCQRTFVIQLRKVYEENLQLACLMKSQKDLK